MAFPHRMRDLVRLTGVPAPTIHFYAQQGLLPAPRKSSGNQATYPESSVSRLRWIRALQTELHLSLRSIGAILERWGQVPVEEAKALQTVGRLLDEPDPAVTRAELDAVRARLAPDDFDALAEGGLIDRRGVTGSELRILEVVAAMRAAGFTPEAGFGVEAIALYQRAVERLVTEEFARVVEPALARHDPATLRDLVNRGVPLANQLLALLHQRAVQNEVQRWLDMEPADDRVDTA